MADRKYHDFHFPGRISEETYLSEPLAGGRVETGFKQETPIFEGAEVVYNFFGGWPRCSFGFPKVGEDIVLAGLHPYPKEFTIVCRPTGNRYRFIRADQYRFMKHHEVGDTYATRGKYVRES